MGKPTHTVQVKSKEDLLKIMKNAVWSTIHNDWTFFNGANFNGAMILYAGKTIKVFKIEEQTINYPQYQWCDDDWVWAENWLYMETLKPIVEKPTTECVWCPVCKSLLDNTHNRHYCTKCYVTFDIKIIG